MSPVVTGGVRPGPKSYRKKTLTRALQFTGTNHAEIAAFTGPDRFGPLAEAVHDSETGRRLTAVVFDFIHAVWIPLADGDWIAEGPRNENYPIAADVFAATYEEAP